MLRHVAIVLVSLASLAGVAAAKPTKKSPPAKHAKSQKPMGNNMPRGWTWPPSRAMEQSAQACEAKLDELGVSWQSTQPEGHIVDAIEILDSRIGGIEYVNIYDKQHAPVMDCQLALALANFAPRLYEVGVREIHVGSTYRWSKVRVGGKTKNMLSRHALGIAMDVVSFVDDSGREAVVARDYKRDDELLLDVERAINDSGNFRLVLTPKNDPISHKDHFHIEANPDYSELADDKPKS
jgi:hypothetical protein